MKNSKSSGESNSATELCLLCSQGINKDDPTNWKQVTGWVGGPKKDSMRLREDTGKLAHDTCVKKLAEGQAPDQPSMFEDVYLTKNSGAVPMSDFDLPDELK